MTNEKWFIAPEDVETLQFDWGRIKWLSTPDVTDSEQLSAGIVQLAPKEGHERHNHPDSEEILYVISGEGIQTVDGEERRITAGEMVHIPAGAYHSTINATWEPLRLLAVYAPPGPEEVLREDPNNSILSAGDLSVETD
ncbi:cupin domain-containing protein [Halococcus sediminicola]|uniref:cupin domain-containing protein n=1 Tax=Halococcus sediminicola TaxID=1264579 RepID=UPI0006798D05|nr:cupin domain-containing protein [Halococcus sediminicola]